MQVSRGKTEAPPVSDCIVIDLISDDDDDEHATLSKQTGQSAPAAVPAQLARLPFQTTATTTATATATRTMTTTTAASTTFSSYHSRHAFDLEERDSSPLPHFSAIPQELENRDPSRLPYSASTAMMNKMSTDIHYGGLPSDDDDDEPPIVLLAASNTEQYTVVRDTTAGLNATLTSTTRAVKPQRRAKRAAEDGEAREEEKRRKQMEKEQAKWERQQERQQAKVQREREAEERKAMRAANKLVTDKRYIATEMIVELDERFVESFGGQSLVVALQAIGAKTKVHRLAHRECVVWKRIVSKTFDTELNAFVPTDREYIHTEPFVLRCFSATTLAEMVAKKSVAEHVHRMRQAFPGKQILVLVDGLDEYYRKIKLEVKRSFTKQLRDEVPASSAATTAVATAKLPDRKEIDQVLLQLNCTHHCNVMTVNKSETATEWLVTYTREVAVRPYEIQKRQSCFNMCVDDIGPSGKTHQDTWSRMLQILHGITPPVADAILERFPTIESYWQACISNPPSAHLLLANLVVSRHGYTATGSVRRIGEAISRQVYDNFFRTDPKYAFR